MDLVDFLDEVPDVVILIVFLVSVALAYVFYEVTMQAVTEGTKAQLVAWCVITILMVLIAAVSFFYGLLRVADKLL